MRRIWHSLRLGNVRGSCTEPIKCPLLNLESYSRTRDQEQRLNQHVLRTYGLVSAALLVNQFDPFTNDEQELRVAYKTLQIQKPHLESNEYAVDYIHQPERLTNIDLAYGYSGDS